MRASVLSLCAFACLAFAAVPVSGAERAFAAKSFDVVDGDTLEIEGEAIELAGIVAPEPGRQCLLSGTVRDCGRMARAALLDLTAGAALECTAVDADREATAYRCRANGYDLSEGMVYTGWAIPREGAPARYFSMLETAMERPRGFWRGAFIEPWTPFATALAGK